MLLQEKRVELKLHSCLENKLTLQTLVWVNHG